MAINRADQNWPEDVHTILSSDVPTLVERTIQTVDEILFPAIKEGENYLDWLVRTR